MINELLIDNLHPSNHLQDLYIIHKVLIIALFKNLTIKI